MRKITKPRFWFHLIMLILLGVATWLSGTHVPHTGWWTAVTAVAATTTVLWALRYTVLLVMWALATLMTRKG